MPLLMRQSNFAYLQGWAVAMQLIYHLILRQQFRFINPFHEYRLYTPALPYSSSFIRMTRGGLFAAAAAMGVYYSRLPAPLSASPHP